MDCNLGIYLGRAFGEVGDLGLRQLTCGVWQVVRQARAKRWAPSVVVVGEQVTEPQAPPLRFLVVDDNEDIRDVFLRLIERAGHVASTAIDGQDAVEVLGRESFDVMLLDLTMPRMDGVGVVRWLHAHPDVAPHMRVVVVSAWAGEHRGVLQELGIDTVMQKPLRLQQLNDLIEEMVLELAGPQAS